MKKGLFICLLGAILAFSLGITVSEAGTVEAILSVTADNIYSVNLNGVNIIPLGYNSDNWQLIDTYALSLNWCETNYLNFYVINIGSYSSGNPAGFLAQVSLVNPEQWFAETGVNEILSNDSDYWHINTNGWNGTIPTAWGANDDSSTVWYSANERRPVLGISGEAQWIWTVKNLVDDGDNAAFVSLRLTPVPEPASLLLLGSGLLGLAAFARAKRKRS